MTISSLISELQKLQALHGDLPVTVNLDWDNAEEISSVEDVMGGDYLVCVSNEGFVAYETKNGLHIHLS